MIDIFKIENGSIVLDVNILTVPEFKAVIDNYEDHLKIFSIIHHYFHPDSSYFNLDDDEKLSILLKDFKGDFEFTDLMISEAFNKMQMFVEAETTERYFRSTKRAVEKLSNYLDTVIISDSKEFGNIQHVMKSIENAGKVIESFKKLENARNESMKKQRGNKLTTWDID
jgi:hypothetical protein